MVSPTASLAFRLGAAIPTQMMLAEAIETSACLSQDPLSLFNVCDSTTASCRMLLITVRTGSIRKEGSSCWNCFWVSCLSDLIEN